MNANYLWVSVFEVALKASTSTDIWGCVQVFEFFPGETLKGIEAQHMYAWFVEYDAKCTEVAMKSDNFRTKSFASKRPQLT